MSIYTPYTYLIGWSNYNKFYYGRRTAKTCHPKEFWKSYFTSSKYVKEFRKENGEPDIIQIRKTFPNNPNACKLWECKVLERIDAQNHPNFLNKRNGDHKWDTTGVVSVMDENGNIFNVSTKDIRYILGELTSIQVEEKIQKKRKKTCVEKYGYEFATQSSEIKEKSKQTCLEKYGYESHNNDLLVKEKKKETNLKNWGVDNVFKSQEIKEKSKQTCLEKYGYEFSIQAPEIKEKFKENSLQNWGYDSPNKSPLVKEKKKQTSLEKYGVSNPNQRIVCCCYCGEYKSISHQSKCELNPERNIPDRNGKNHPQKKTFKVVSPEGKVTIIETVKSLEEFAKNLGLKYWTFAHNRKYKGWIIEEIKY